MTDRQHKIEQHEATNRECAELVLKDPARYGGEGVDLVIWARMVLDLERERPAKNWTLVA
jgi:hypothetical protein